MINSCMLHTENFTDHRIYCVKTLYIRLRGKQEQLKYTSCAGRSAAVYIIVCRYLGLITDKFICYTGVSFIFINSADFSRLNKSVAQVMIRWSVQNGFITIPKSTKPERIIENSAVFDFALTNEDLRVLVSNLL
jgi:hypothetical protein